MTRRDLIALLGGAVASRPRTGTAQPEMRGNRAHRLAELATIAESVEITRQSTLPELAKLGFSEGYNLIVDERWGEPAALAGLTRELLLGKPDAIFAIGPGAIRAAHQATSTVPIVTFGADPVQLGLAASYARPGGNITGVMTLSADLDAKRLHLLHEAVPEARRVAYLWALSATPNREASEKEARSVAARSGLEILAFDVAGPDDYPAAFAAMRAAGAEAVVVMSSPVFYRDTVLLARLALDAGLPAICEWAESARSGCMLGYGAVRLELRRRAAHLITHILQGTAPGDLPIEYPTHYEFAVNLKTASALGLTVPQAILARADEVIE